MREHALIQIKSPHQRKNAENMSMAVYDEILGQNECHCWLLAEHANSAKAALSLRRQESRSHARRRFASEN
jgi:ferredoxin-thioredoxin reductase catalytic subunit